MRKYPLLGSYVPLNKENGFLPGALKTAIDEDANTFMFYTGAPQNTARQPIENFHVEEFQKELKEVGMDIKNLCIHAPYVINLANSKKPATFNFGIEFLISELNRAAAIGVRNVVLHPGAAVGATPIEGMDQLIKGLNEVNKHKPKGVRIALETMAGKGTEIGINFDQMAYIISNLDNSEDIGVCFDTCHMFDAGYDIKNDWESVKKEFDEKVGLDKVFVMHVNDSKFGYESHKDRHAQIGYGQIGFEALYKIVQDDDLKDVPKFLETPYIGKYAPYKDEIKALISGTPVEFPKEVQDEIESGK